MPVEQTEIARFWKKPTASKGTFVDLFCGAGGLTKGLELAGFEGICGLDWFQEAGETYARNFDHPFVNGDIKLQEVKDRFYETVRERLNGRKLTLVAGGFPCQGFSLAGNRIVDDPRNSLYLELIEIVKNLQPEFVLCENVKGLRSMLGGRVEAKILGNRLRSERDRFMRRRLSRSSKARADYFYRQSRRREKLLAETASYAGKLRNDRRSDRRFDGTRTRRRVQPFADETSPRYGRANGGAQRRGKPL